MTDEQAARLFTDVEKLSLPDQLRLAARLLDEQRPELAWSVAHRVFRELDAALAVARRVAGESA